PNLTMSLNVMAMRTESGGVLWTRLSCAVSGPADTRPVIRKQTAGHTFDESPDYVPHWSRVDARGEWGSSLHLGSSSHRVRTVTGRPKRVIRLRALHPILLSVR